MQSTIPVSLDLSGRSKYSCIRCAERKVKCDRNIPCSTCVRHNVDCHFNPLQPPRNRRKHLNSKILSEKLRHYEALLRERDIDPNQLQNELELETHAQSAQKALSNEHQAQSSTQSEPQPRQTINRAQMIQGSGRFKLVNNILWTRIVEEFHDLQDALEDASDDASDTDSPKADLHFIFSDKSKSYTKSPHPPPHEIHQLWQIFVENIDPLTKIVHVPTLRPAIEKTVSTMHAIPQSFHALMFAIYSAAVMSLTHDECQTKFHEPRNLLLSRYTSATEIALSEARFMGTTNLVVLQALIIHLFAIRDIYEPRAVWSLTGVAVRIAQSMGLDRDGLYLGIPPFETEIRRRVWWQLKMHDFRTAELCGIGKFQDLYVGDESTKWPSNVDDAQLYPGMTSLPATEANKLTDMVFVALKCEFLNYAATRAAHLNKQGSKSRPWNPDAHPRALQHDTTDQEGDSSYIAIESHLEMTYLRYCDPSQPLHLISQLMARSAINTIHFMTHHPRRWASRDATPPAERQRIWELCLRLLKQHNALQTNSLLRRFAWYAPYFRQWHAVIHVLDSLRAEPMIADAERAWALIGGVFENILDSGIDKGVEVIYRAVGNLCLKTHEVRESALGSKDGAGNTRFPSFQTPEFIVRLRQQRDSALAKRREKDAKRYQLENEHNKIFDNGLRPAEEQTENSRGTSNSLHRDDPSRSIYDFGLDDRSDRNQFGVDMNNLDTYMQLGTMFDHEYDFEENNVINWDQWDSWLANSNLDI